MRSLAWVLAALLAAGCGPLKNVDPLGGLGGADNARYGFESGVEGWAKPTSEGSSTYSVFQAPGRSLYGQASLAMAVLSLNKANPMHGRVSIVFGIQPDLAGKTVGAWVYSPPGCQVSDSQPSYLQIYARDASGVFANNVGPNVAVGTWARLQFSPIANPATYTVEVSQGSFGGSFNPSAISELGIRVGVSDAAPADFRFDGVFLIDSVDW